MAYRKKQNKTEVFYEYVEPASAEERAEAKRRMERAYDILFTEALKHWPDDESYWGKLKSALKLDSQN